MKIAFIGDSFCSGITDHSWTNLVARHLGAEIACRGIGGTSVGQAYFDLVGNLESSDLYIICWTDHNRLYNPHAYPLNYSSCHEYMRDGMSMGCHDLSYYPDSTIWDAGAAYYRHLFDFRYHELVHELIIDRCDVILAEHISANPHKRAIHFHSFRPVNGSKASFRSGAYCSEALADMLARIGGRHFAGQKDDNHMSVEQNAAFAAAVCAVIDSRSDGEFSLP